MKSIGIDIGTYSIKVVEITLTTKGFHVTQFLEYPLNLNHKDHALDIIEHLKNFTDSYDPLQTRFVIGLRQDMVSVRHKFFPFKERQKIHKSLAFELEDDIPFAFDTAVFDAKVIRFFGSTSEVLAAAAQKDAVINAIALAKDGGADPVVLSSESFALANIFEKWDEPPPTLTEMLPPDSTVQRRFWSVLQMGHTHCVVNFFEGTTLVNTRAIAWGATAIAENIARKYQLPYFEAIKEMQAKAFLLTSKRGATQEQVTFSDTISEGLEELIQELKLSLLEATSQFNAIIESMYISGGPSRIENLGPYLTQQLEVPVNRTTLMGNFPTVMFEKTPHIETVAGVALGLAVEGIKRPKNPPMNFLRGIFAKESQAFKVFWENWGRTLQLAAASIVVLFVYSILRENAALDLADRANEVVKTQAKAVAHLPPKTANLAGVKKYIQDNRKRIAETKTLTQVLGMNSALDVVKKISDAAPGKNLLTLDVNALRVRENRVELEGFLKTKAEVTAFQTALKSVALGGQVQSKPSTLNKAGRVAFNFQFSVDRNISKETR